MYGVPMTEPRRRNTDIGPAVEGRRAAAARRRALKAAVELRDTMPRAWGLEAFSDLTMLGHKAVDIIEAEIKR